MIFIVIIFFILNTIIYQFKSKKYQCLQSWFLSITFKVNRKKNIELISVIIYKKYSEYTEKEKPLQNGQFLGTKKGLW